MARSRRRHTVESFPYILVLLVLYIAYYGAILLYSRGLPYVMDANESFSVYWHSYNLLHFDITRSFGLTDEAFSMSAAAHPYLHTHQGNMPRLFGALIYTLGARSIEAQIIVTTAVIGTATMMCAFFTMRRLANPLFAFIFTALLITDYLQFAQWNVVTYRVWYGFLFFSILLGIMRGRELRGGWTMAGLFGSFALLFYNELVFAGLMAIIGGLFTAYWHRKHVRLVLKLWAVEIAGAAMAVAILAAQLLAKFGPSVVEQDFATTFLTRNFSDNVEALDAAVEFFKQNGIAFWLNVGDASRFRSLTYFVRAQTFYVFQFYTPWLMLVATVILSGLVLSVMIDRKLRAVCIGQVMNGQLATLIMTQCHWFAGLLTVVAGMVLVGMPSRTTYNTRDTILAIVAGAALAVTTLATASRSESSKWQKSIATVRDSKFGLVIQILAVVTLGFFVFTRPTSFILDGALGFSAAVCGVCIVYGTARHCGGRTRSLRLVELRARYATCIPVRGRAWLQSAYAVTLLLLFVSLGKGSEIFGIASRSELGNSSHMHLALAFLLALISSRVLTGQSGAPVRRQTVRRSMFFGFLLMVIIFIRNQYVLYDQNFSMVWTLPLDIPGGEPMARLLVLVSVFLGGSFIMRGWRRLLRVSDATALLGPLALFVIGELALAVIFYMSPGYVITGYLQRAAPFAVFFTSLSVATALYVLAVAGRRGQATSRRVIERSDVSMRTVVRVWCTPSRMAVRILAHSLLSALSLYWIALQGTYVWALPANYFEFLAELRQPPLAGKSAVVNTYAAPVAAMTGRWAYFDGTSVLNILNRTDGGYVVERDMRSFLWLADRDTNVEYRRPDYVICLWKQSLRNVVADRGGGFSDAHSVCSRVPIVVDAARRAGLMRHELVAADPSPRGSWAIVKVDHELPPLAQGVTATVTNGRSGLTVKASYRYVQQDGTPEEASVVELVGEKPGHDCAVGSEAGVLGRGSPGEALVVPHDFSGTMAVRVTPVSTRKAGEPTLSNQFMVRAGVPHVMACPLDLVFDFREANIWRRHAVAGLALPGPQGSLFSGGEAKLLIDVPAPGRGAVGLGVTVTRVAQGKDLEVACEVNGTKYGPFAIAIAQTSVEYVMQVPASVARKEIPMVVAVSIAGDGGEFKQIALRQLSIHHRE